MSTDGWVADPQEWLAADPDPLTRAELQLLLDADDRAGLQDRFGSRLRFGTAGLRGMLGAGPNRMNRVVVRQAAAALAEHFGPGALVMIGYDARPNSDVFAADTAAVLLAAGCRPRMLPPLVPTPVVSYAVRATGATAGVMVTASHNPPGDSGYKVYLRDGGQIIPPHDRAIEQLMAEQPLPDPHLSPVDPDQLAPDTDIAADYLDLVTTGAPPLGEVPPLSVAYTPLQGVGWPYVREAFERTYHGEPFVVREEAEPDGMFRNVASPNPEHPEAMQPLIRRATDCDVYVALANDPDADRLAVATWTPDDPWRMLTGDEIGALLADWILPPQGHRDPDDPPVVVAGSIVSGRLVSCIAEHWGIPYVETLTGFKWIARAGLDRNARLLLGFEEAYGYAVNDFVRDKDGISAAVTFVTMARYLAQDGKTPGERLLELFEEFGWFRTWRTTVDLEGRRGDEMMARIRESLPQAIGGLEVRQVTDYLQSPTGLAASDVLRFDLAEQARVSLRPSGTEPILKGYVETVSHTPPPSGQSPLVEAVRQLIPES